MGEILASGSADSKLLLWETQTGKLLRVLEGHTDTIVNVTFAMQAGLLASKSLDNTIRLWDCETWETLAVIPTLPHEKVLNSALTFHPKLPLLAAGGGDQAQSYLWELDLAVLLRERSRTTVAVRAVHHTTAKIVLLGDHSVGKSALGHRLIHGAFKEQASTHGRQFWVYPELGKRRNADRRRSS